MLGRCLEWPAVSVRVVTGHWRLCHYRADQVRGPGCWPPRCDGRVAIVVSGVLTPDTDIKIPPRPAQSSVHQPPSDGRVEQNIGNQPPTSPIWDLQVAGEQHSINGVWGGRALTRLVLRLLDICAPFTGTFLHTNLIYLPTICLYTQGGV